MPSIWHDHYTLEAINARRKNSMMEWLDIKFMHIGEDYLQAKMPVDHRTRQPAGILHGGASCALAETVGSVAASMVINPNTHICVGLSIYTSHIRTIREGWVTATAKALHLGRTTHVWNILIQNEQDQIISDTRLTMAILDIK